MTAEDILTFWFEELTPEAHFKKDPAMDAQITERFLPLLESAEKSELWQWRSDARSSLAEIIVLDQFSRNIFRGQPRSFQNDAFALSLAQTAIIKGFDRELPISQRSFLYMPYMHSESLKIHEQAMKLFSQKGLEFNLKFEQAHKAIIEQFGRYPHRNKILGRENTLAEAKFLRENPEGF
ncbi:MAG: DUF924 family protein [Bdellovibrionota bacterium]